MVAAPAADAATVSGRVEGDTLMVRFRAEPGERSELRVLRHETGVRFASGQEVATGPACFAVRPGDVRCGPPGAGGLEVFVRTGGADDSVFTRIGHRVWLGHGADNAIGKGQFDGGPGDDRLIAILGQGILAGGPGEDALLARKHADILDGGPGPDLLVGGHGEDELTGGGGFDQIAGGFGLDSIFAGPGNDFIRAAEGEADLIRCGPGHDRVHVDRRDRTTGCEDVRLGWRP